LKKAGLDIGKSPAGNKKLYKNFADDLLRIKVS